METLKRLLTLAVMRRGFPIDSRANEHLETRARVAMAHPNDADVAALPPARQPFREDRIS